MTQDDYCDMCKGNKLFLGKEYVCCNGTGEWNFAAQAYIKNHICQCIIFTKIRKYSEKKSFHYSDIRKRVE